MKKIILSIVVIAAVFCGTWVLAKNTPNITLGTISIERKSKNTSGLTKKSFTNVKIGMSHKDMVKAVGTNFVSKNQSSVFGTDCTLYQFGDMSHGLAVMESEDGKVIGKMQYGLIDPKETVTDEKVQGLPSNTTMDEVKRQLGKGTVGEEVKVDDNSAAVLLYRSKNHVWSLVFSNNVLTSINAEN